MSHFFETCQWTVAGLLATRRSRAKVIYWHIDTILQLMHEAICLLDLEWLRYFMSLFRVPFPKTGWRFCSAYFRHFSTYDSEETTLNYGGAQYIPTGRGLATSREPFMKSFRCFAPSHMYDALEAGGLGEIHSDVRCITNATCCTLVYIKMHL